MNIFEILLFLNKISLFAFIITFIVLIYQFYLIKKDISLKLKKKPNIPNFNENIKNNLNYTPLINKEEKINKNKLIVTKKSYFFIYILILILIIAFLIFLFSFFKTKERSDNILTNEKLINNIPTDATKNKEKIPSSFIEKNFLSPTERLASPTLIIIKIESTITQEDKPETKTTITYIKKNELINSPIKIQQLPIAGIIDKNFLIIVPGIFLILFSLFF